MILKRTLSNSLVGALFSFAKMITCLSSNVLWHRIKHVNKISKRILAKKIYLNIYQKKHLNYKDKMIIVKQ